MTADRYTFAALQARFGYWTSRASVLCILLWTIVGIMYLGGSFHDLFCAKHGAWPLV